MTVKLWISGARPKTLTTSLSSVAVGACCAYPVIVGDLNCAQTRSDTSQCAAVTADAQAMIAASGREDIGILVDALHFWRAGESLAALSSLPAHHLNYMQLCDGAAQRPESEQELIRQARSARNVPGEGGLDLHGLMAALPATLPVSLEVPLDGEQGALPPLQRAQLLFNAAQPYLRSCA